MAIDIGSADGVEAADMLRRFYWRVVTTLVLGDSTPEMATVYREAWLTCMERLDTPGPFMFEFVQKLPTELNRRYWRTTARLRSLVREAVVSSRAADAARVTSVSASASASAAADAGAGTGAGTAPIPTPTPTPTPTRCEFSFLRHLEEGGAAERLSLEDTVEVLLELMFTGR